MIWPPQDRRVPADGVPPPDTPRPAPDPDNHRQAWSDLTDRARALKAAAVSPGDRVALAALVADISNYRQAIEVRAYERWVHKGRPAGTAQQDWAEAEQEVERESATAVPFAELADRVHRWEQDRMFRVAEHAVTLALSVADSPAAAAAACLTAAAGPLGCGAGVFWAADPRAGVLGAVEVWHDPAVPVGELAAATRVCLLGPGDGLPGRVWTTAQPGWVFDLTRSPDPRLRAAARDGFRGVVAVPVTGGKAVVGVLELFTRDGLATDDGAVQFLSDVGCQLGQFVERREAEAALHEQREERRLARAIQQGFLPKSSPSIPGFSVYGVSYPAEVVGGDYFDFVPMPDGRIGVVIGDVSGHGVGAALTMGQVRACMRALALTHGDVSAILGLCNRRLVEDITSDVFTTLFLARLDIPTRTLEYANAGHWPGYLFGTDGEVRLELGSTGLPLGVDPAGEFPVGEPVELRPGELLLLVTDGIVEAVSPEGEPYGIERALDVVRAHRAAAPAEVIEALFRSVRDFTGNRPRDDITAVVLKG